MHRIFGRHVQTAVTRPQLSPPVSHRLLSTTQPLRDRARHSNEAHINVEELLSQSTWSVEHLLPAENETNDSPQVTSQQLHHLLRLSALPPPKDAEEEARMLSTLSSQLHFVKQIQKADTTDVEPLWGLRDETQQGEKEAELGVEALKDALEAEELRGNYHKRIRRRREEPVKTPEEEWDPFQTAGERVGRYYVVDGGKRR